MNKVCRFKHVKAKANTPKDVEAIKTKSSKGYLQIRIEARYKGFVYNSRKCVKL